jgi:hypothetical protein
MHFIKKKLILIFLIFLLKSIIKYQRIKLLKIHIISKYINGIFTLV